MKIPTSLIWDAALFLLLGILVPCSFATSQINTAPWRAQLPVEVAQVLQAPTQIVLYSLEPAVKPDTGDETLHGFKVLGKTDLKGRDAQIATRAFESAISPKRELTKCFEPRHALRVTSGPQTYDLILCYVCHELRIYKGDRLLVSLTASQGSPKVLNDILTTAKIPLAAAPKIGIQTGAVSQPQQNGI